MIYSPLGYDATAFHTNRFYLQLIAYSCFIQIIGKYPNTIKMKRFESPSSYLKEFKIFLDDHRKFKEHNRAFYFLESAKTKRSSAPR